MDGLILVAVLTVLAVPVSILVLFVQTSGLKRRIAALEQALARKGATAAVEAAAPLGDHPAPDPSGQAAPEPAPQISPPQAATLPPEQDPRPATLPADDARIAAVSPWDRAKPPTAPSPRPARAGALWRWLQANWVYAVSAASLGLAGIFFVQYGMERGLLPPGLRVLAALVFGAGLIGAGEWLRRRHGDEGETATAMLPSVFSGAGVVTLFAAILAARQLYGLIGPTAAFAGHLGTAALAVAIGWFSGPLLVAVGLVGAFAAPFIVGGGSDSVDWLYGYFALIAALGLGVDAVRRWAWVSVLALVLGYAGGLLMQLGGGSDASWTAQLVALALLAVILPELRLIPSHAGPAITPQLLLPRKDHGGKIGLTVALAMAAMSTSSLGLFLLAAEGRDGAMLAFAALALLAVMALLWADRAEGLVDLALPPALGFLFALAAQGVGRNGLARDFAAQALALRAPETAAPMTVSLLLGLSVLMSAAAGFRALRAPAWGVAFGLGAMLVAPLAAVILELSWTPAAVLGPFPWALHVIALAAGMVGFALRLAKRDAPDMRRAAHAALAALSLIALALFILTTKAALTLALAVLVVVAAALDRRFRLAEMSLFLQAGTAVLGYRLLADPGLPWALDAPLPQVLLAFGGAIGAMTAALWLMRPLERPMARAVAESAAAGLAAILANVLVTRWLDVPPPVMDSASYAPQTLPMETHWGLTLNALPWAVFALMQLWRARLPDRLQPLRRGLAALGGAIAGLGFLAAATQGNPLFGWSAADTGALVRGPLVLDSLLLAYGLPGLALLALAWRWAALGPRLRLALAIAGAALTALYAGLEIRRVWQGDFLGAPGVTQAELYSYTLALMILGAGLLYQAITRRSDSLRRLAMAVIALVVAKVFLIDAAGLTGLTRVVSFAGLGLSLAGLAWLNRWAGRRS